MYKKILFGTCLTDYCEHIFNFALNLAKENDAKLWIYYGIGRLNLDEPKAEQAIKEAEARVTKAYVEQMKDRGFDNYVINVSDGDVVSELSKLARNAAVDLMVMGTSTDTPLAMGETTNAGSLGPIAADTLLWAPCPVMIIPPSLIPGLARG
ncbi:MAG: universal stress protein [Desulfobacula sp.]|uniref:universal stress protein n=1 Tax=Desulfobacula sp. TaxID=2593537 RepID=UPI0025C5EC0F|nr:universal stress protein [Desulfobacula sp.]MCD4720729.1 universal stress protein [Desulfobacula sp.]